MLRKKTQRRKTNSKKTKTTNRDILEEVIRVDHAGEYGATRIYDGQIAIFGNAIKNIIDKYFNLLVSLFFILLIGSIFIIKLL